MRLALAVFFMMCGAWCPGFCQIPAPAFEVASIKPSDGHFGIDMKTFPSRLSSTCNVNQLIEAAYSLERWQVIGGPAWLDTDLFDIEAKTSEDMSGETDHVLALGRPAPRKMMLMLQTLLAERFSLKVHRETRQENVFVLVVAKGGPKLQAPKDTTRSGIASGRTGGYGPGPAVGYYAQGFNASMVQIAHELESVMRRRVLDQTGLSGNYDFRFEYGDDSTTGNAPAYLTAFQDATGLKLNTAKGPVEFLVVDHADKPSAN
jgi:uncharacterized protein (TIGR03435 family)